MSSQIPAVLDALETRLNAIPGLVAVNRVLEGRAYPSEIHTSDFPTLSLRLISDAIETAQNGKARITLTLHIEVFVLADDAFSDATLLNWVWEIRHALGVDEQPPLNGLLRRDTGIEWQPAVYGYPDPGSVIALARQPLTLHLIEHY